MEDSAIDDFDFYMGEWQVKNKRQMDDGKWIEFTSTVEARKTLNGLGNIDFFKSEINGKPFHGMTMRLFDEESNSWQIYWLDTDDPASLPEPSIGRFEDGKGEFFKTITTESGRKVRIRFLWKDITKDAFSWESAWSIDGSGGE